MINALGMGGSEDGRIETVPVLRAPETVDSEDSSVAGNFNEILCGVPYLPLLRRNQDRKETGNRSMEQEG